MKNKRFLPAISVFISTTMGSGFFPVAPGTIGAIIAILVMWFLPEISWQKLLFSSVLFYFIGVWAARETERKLQKHDPGCINWDEVVGMMISLIAVPKTWIVYIVAFVLFRFFDIVKPQPVDASQKLSGGWGVMTDDVIAGIYSNIILQILFRVFFKLG